MAQGVEKDDLFTDIPHYKEAFTHLLDNIDKGVLFTNSKKEIIYTNGKFSEITGYTFPEVKGKTPKFLQSGVQNETFYQEMNEQILAKGKWKGKLWNRSKDGSISLYDLSIYGLKNEQGYFDNFIGFLDKLSDGEEEKDIELLDDAYYDSLTHLPNRDLLYRRLQASGTANKSRTQDLSLLLFQIKNFQEINANYGLVFGNMLLKRIANRVERLIPTDSMLARWDGTVFALVIEGDVPKKKIAEIVDELSATITAPYVINGISLNVEVHFGVVLHQKMDDPLTVAKLIERAEEALARAKRETKLFCFFDSSIVPSDSFIITEAEILRSLHRGEFELYYQPLFATDTQELVGFESLIRWQHPTEGLIPPGDFIPLAEKTGVIQELGKYVFKEACRQQVVWEEKGYDDIIISVNLSMNQFKDDELVPFIQATLEETGANPRRINIELTESTFNEDVEKTIQKLKQLSKLGLTIAMDDFGTGYSSLGYLIDFPIHIIKIDRSFINVLDENEKIEAIVKAINSMAESLNIEVVAEGVETNEQYELVKKLNCNIVQGFLFDRPRSVEETEAIWLNQTSTNRLG